MRDINHSISLHIRAKEIPLAAKLAIGELEFLRMILEDGEARKKSSNRLCRPNSLVYDIVFDDVLCRRISAEYETVLHENKAEIRTEGGPTKTLCVCFYFIIIILGSTFRQRTFKRIVCFSFSVLFCLSRKPNAIASMLL